MSLEHHISFCAFQRAEELLAQVGQSPSKSIQDALLPSAKALISDTLFRHSDNDVKVTVVSCIAELTRISAPNAPYGDDHMKVTVYHFTLLQGQEYSSFVNPLTTF